MKCYSVFYEIIVDISNSEEDRGREETEHGDRLLGIAEVMSKYQKYHWFYGTQ